MSIKREITWTIRYFPVDNSALIEELKAVIKRLEKLLVEMED